MEIITQFIQNLNSLSKLIFNIVSFLDPLNITDNISQDLANKIDNPVINDLISNISSSLSKLSILIEPISKEFKHNTFRKPVNEQKPYASFKIDKPPIVKDSSAQCDGNYKQLSFEDILSNNEIKPVKRREKFEYDGVCPHCGAPKEYIYSNSKGIQYKCKCCNALFTLKKHYHEEITHHCPYCNYKLFTHHKRDNYNVLVCSNDNCSFYLKNKTKVRDNNCEDLKTHTGGFKLRYTFRLFNFTFNEIKDDINNNHYIKSKINLNNIHHSQYVLGLILSYYINYGNSSRRTSQILDEIHGIKISHQTIMNYAEAAAKQIEKLNEEFDYSKVGLSNTLTGDETYINVAGKTNYVFFFSDTKKKIITSYRIFPNRDTLCAIKSIYQSINKYKTLPQPFSIVTDGNPIYNAAQVFFKLNDINFDLYQVIGLKNKDEQSKTYRSYKQVEERLNRTYKFNYYGTNGYGTNRGANIYMVLYVAYYNFLRKHTALNKQVPIYLKDIDEIELMPNKWLKLLSIC